MFDKSSATSARIQRLAFVHIDGDLYQSVLETWLCDAGDSVHDSGSHPCKLRADRTKDAFEKVWDRVSDGGIVVVDDFFHKVQGPARASAEQAAHPF